MIHRQKAPSFRALGPLPRTPRGIHSNVDRHILTINANQLVRFLSGTNTEHGLPRAGVESSGSVLTGRVRKPLLKRFSLFAFPAVCIAALAVLAACGGSGGRSSPRPPTLEETVASVRAADTPALGQVAYQNVASYLGFANDPLYRELSGDTRSGLASTYGTLIARANTSGSNVTYGDVIEAIAEEVEAVLDLNGTLAQLNTDLANAPTHTATWAQNELLLIRTLEGTVAAEDKQINPAAAIALARWYVARFAPEGEPLTRGPCEDACRAQFRADFDRANAVYSAAIAPLLAAVRRGELTGNEYTRLATPLRAARSAARQRAHQRFTACIADCHQQG